MPTTLRKVRAKLANVALGPVERLYRSLEFQDVSRFPSVLNIPPKSDREGAFGSRTYGEWAYSIGLFQGLIFNYHKSTSIRALDVGCGVGRLYLALQPLMKPTDSYLGLDIDESAILRCKRLYQDPNATFLHVTASNGYYAANMEYKATPWPIQNGAHNLITALSVWSHLREEDWRFYLREVSRVLEPKGRAIITMFVLDEIYEPQTKRHIRSPLYFDHQDKFIFDTPAYGSESWLYPSWAAVPEVAIGVKKASFQEEISAAGLSIVDYLPGQWKDKPGYTFQDVVILEKPA